MDRVPSVYNEPCPDCGGKLLYNGIALVCTRCPYCRPAQDSSKTLPVMSSQAGDYCPDCGGKLLNNGESYTISFANVPPGTNEITNATRLRRAKECCNFSRGNVNRPQFRAGR